MVDVAQLLEAPHSLDLLVSFFWVSFFYLYDVIGQKKNIQVFLQVLIQILL